MQAWVANSMPPLAWFGHDGAESRQYEEFLSARPSRTGGDSRPISPCPISDYMSRRHRTDNVIVATPDIPLQGDGRSFLRSTPTFFRPRLGRSDAPKVRALLDNCANLCLANKTFVLTHAPDSVIRDDFTTGVDGIGSARTVGYVHLPLYIDCLSRIEGRTCKVELHLEIHLVDNLPVDLIVGMDAIRAYGIDTIISRSIATLSVHGCDLAFPIEFHRLKGSRDPASQDHFPVLCQESIVIPPMHDASVKVILGVKLDGDSWLQPIYVKNDNRLLGPMDGGWVAAGPIRAGQPAVLFANMSTRPIRLRRGQTIADIIPCSILDYLGRTGISHLPPSASPPSAFSCVPKRGNVHSAVPPSSPASLIDPHNRDPPSSDTDAQSHGLFDVSVAYGLNGTPPSAVIQVLESRMDAFTLDGRPGYVDSIRIPINTDDSKLTAEALRHVGPNKRKIIDDSIDQLLAWDVIERSNSRVGYPVVLVHQHDKWRFCLDYRNLNLATTTQVYPMTCTDSIFDALHGKRVFSILDAARWYHQLPIAEKDHWKTAFITHRGLYQYKRMPFGLKNAPIQFQSFMDSVLGSLRWTAALVYIDDILIFSEDISSHTEHLQTLGDSAIAVGLKFNPSKCHFAYPSLCVLGHRVSTEGLSILDDRAAAIRELATPRTLKELWHVLGIFGYYRQFIPRYALIAAPLTRLTRGVRFQKLPDGTWQPREVSRQSSVRLDGWGPSQDTALAALKDPLSSPPTLAFPNFQLPFIVYVDASHDGMAACLHQPFISTDELPLVSQTPPTAAFLSSRFVTTSACPLFSFALDDKEVSELRCALHDDTLFSSTYKSLLSGSSSPAADGFELVNDILYWRLPDGRLAVCLPLSLVPRVLSAAHDSFGHWGFEKTLAMVKNRFYRPGLSSTVRDYVRACPDCQRVKPSRLPRLGDMSPHAMGPTSFHTVSMDVVLGLPPAGSTRFDACMVIVDQFSKAVVLRPTVSTASAPECARVFFDALVSRGFLPSRLITDRDPRFVSDFWAALMKHLRIDCKLISAYHQQADPAERYIQTIQTLLRLYVIQDEWVDCLPFIELIVNNTPNSSTGFSPNQLIFVDPPHPIPILTAPPPDDSAPEVAARLATAKSRIAKARDNLVRASALQKRNYHSRHSRVALEAGDRVFVLLEDHPIRSLVRGMDKLKDKQWGPFEIIEMVGKQAARLRLPPSSRVHPVISTLHLQKFVEDKFGRVCKPPPAGVIDGDDAWEVDYIFGERSCRSGHTEFKVKWVGYPDTEFT